MIVLAVERILIHTAIRKIPVRVLINGTRGKSSVAEYIAAGLRSAGKVPLAKITGIVPTLILPSGEKKYLKRRGPARVQEQFRILMKAKKYHADVLILECMSLNPEYQKLESRFLAPTIYIITGIEEDHLEEMGMTHEERQRNICSAIPPKSLVIAPDDHNRNVIQQFADKKNSKVMFVPTDSEEPLPAGIFSVNIALASTAIAQISGPESGDVIVQHALDTSIDDCLSLSGHRRFINGFAVNDVRSVERFISQWKTKLNIQKDSPYSIILNTRADRPKRTDLFCRWLSDNRAACSIYLTGDHIHYAKRKLKSANDRIHVLHSISTQTLAQMLSDSKTDDLIFGIGNIAGDGFRIIDSFRQIREEVTI
jgi:poly-gamma-glutamate synthase PgsB/CapB